MLTPTTTTMTVNDQRNEFQWDACADNQMGVTTEHLSCYDQLREKAGQEGLRGTQVAARSPFRQRIDEWRAALRTLINIGYAILCRRIYGCQSKFLHVHRAAQGYRFALDIPANRARLA